MREEWDAARSGDARGGGDGSDDEQTIVVEDEALRRGFTQLPNYLFEIRGLSHSAKLTYGIIMSYAWQKGSCFPGQDKLARTLEVSTRSVIEYLKELQSHQLIRIQRRGLGKTNVYHILRYPPLPDTAPDASHPEVKPASHPGLKRSSAPDTQDASHADPRRTAPPDLSAASDNKHVTSKRARTEKTPRQQNVAAAGPKSRAVSDTATTLPLPVQIADTAADEDASTNTVHMATVVLRTYGIRNVGVLAELAADPTEVFAQIERLQHELERGTVAHPAGWLVEAIRGRYRAGQEGATSDGSGVEHDALASSPHATSTEFPFHTQDGTTTATTAGEAASDSPQEMAWRAVCAELRAELTPENYDRWFAPTVALSFADGRLVVGALNAFDAQWLDRRLRWTIERAAARVLAGTAVEFVVSDRASA